MRTVKHLPLAQWPNADHVAFRAAYEPSDLFDDTGGPGHHLAAGTRGLIKTCYRRWMGFLKTNYPEDFLKPPDERITTERVRDFVDHLTLDVRPASVAIAIDNLYYAARLIAPARDWGWLAAVKGRLQARARPQDRFSNLVPPRDTLDLGIELMDKALAQLRSDDKIRDIQYRDGLLLVVLSIWPIRRRSLAALTVTRHIERGDDGINVLLHPADTKSQRADSCPVPASLLPYVKTYLNEIRPHFVGAHAHDGLWASNQPRALSAGHLYRIARKRVMDRFGKEMSLHDFRRSAATYLAMDAPELIDLIPGVLQHTSPDVSEQHYNLARTVNASQRYATVRAKMRKRLRPSSTPRLE